MLIRHSALYVVAKLAPGAIGVLTTALLTRLLPPDAYGQFAVALLVMNFGAAVAFEWVGLTYLRFAAGSGAVEQTFKGLFAAMVAGTALLAAATIPALPADMRWVALAGLLLMWASAWFEFAARAHVAELRPGTYLRMNLGRALLVLAGAAGMAWLTRDPALAAVGMAAGMLAGAALGGVRPRAPGRFDRATARAALRFGLPLAASLALNTATGSATRFLVGALGSVEALGFYTASFVLVQNSLTMVSAGLSSAGFSLAARALESGNREAARRQLAANGALLVAVLLPAAVGMALVADSLAATLVGPAFRASVATLTPVLAACAALGGFRAHYLDHAFQLGNRMRGQVAVTGTAAAVTIGLDLLLIPRWGAAGAAASVLAGAAASVLHAAWAGRAAFSVPFPWGALMRVVPACLVMALAVLAVPAGGAAALAAKVAAGALAYAAAAIGLDVLGARRMILGRRRAA